MTAPDGEAGPLRRRLMESGLTLTAGTVLDPSNDPYRCDTPAQHRDARWLATQLDRLLGTRRIHLRGLHYALVASADAIKPNGELYVNDAANWSWIQGALKKARWNGYIAFNRITDERNAEPVIWERDPVLPKLKPWGTVHVSGLYVDFPDLTMWGMPLTSLHFFYAPQQPFRLVIFTEKSSLSGVVMPIAERFCADAYIVTGEISYTLVHQMAKNGADDGRPMLVFTLCDCDPSGYQMPVSIARKLQAFRDLLFPGLDFEVLPVALSVEQVRELGLPSNPVKETDPRAERWHAAHPDVEQVEIDALGTLRPALLARIITEAIEPFFDATIYTRVSNASAAWTKAAERAIAGHMNGAAVAGLRTEAEALFADMRAQIDALQERMELEAAGLYRHLPPAPVLPEIEIDTERQARPLVSSAWNWVEQTRALQARRI